MPRFTGRAFKYPARAAFLYYLALIFLGSVVLTHPQCRRAGAKPIGWLDAFFTATSATCVTGLSVRSIEHDFSPLGQFAILVMIQVGGIGIMTITTFISIQIAGRASLRQRLIVAETLGAYETTDMRGVLRRILQTTLLIESVGVFALTMNNVIEYRLAPANALWHATFHSVSAFCNAGMALHDSNLIAYRADPVVNGVICGLIITGGIGYPVLIDLRENWHGPWYPRWNRLLVHSKLMLIGTAVLLATGFAGTLALEWNGALATLPLHERVLVAAFHSTATRTAGFNTIDIAQLSAASLFLTVLLMMIGGGPCSTAGGFKVSTLMVLMLRGWATFRGYASVHFARRTIPSHTIGKAHATAILFGAVAIVAVFLLLSVEVHFRQGAQTQSNPAPLHLAATPEEARGTPPPLPKAVFLDIAFEVTSALGTVGLSTGITPQLSAAGKWVIIVLMFIGRLGPISVFAALSGSEKDQPVGYPNEEPLIG